MSASTNPISVIIQNPYLPDYQYTATVPSESTVASLKATLHREYAPPHSPQQRHPHITSQRLICSGRLLHDHEIIHNIRADKVQPTDPSATVVLHLLIKPSDSNSTNTLATGTEVKQSPDTPLTSTPATSITSTTSGTSATSATSSNSATATSSSSTPVTSATTVPPPAYTPEQLASYYQQVVAYQQAYLQYLYAMYPYMNPMMNPMMMQHMMIPQQQQQQQQQQVQSQEIVPPVAQTGLRQRHVTDPLVTSTTASSSGNIIVGTLPAVDAPDRAQQLLRLQQNIQQHIQQMRQQQQQQQPQPQPPVQGQAQVAAQPPAPQDAAQAAEQADAIARVVAAAAQRQEAQARPPPAYMRYIDLKLIGKMIMLLLLFGQDGDMHRLSILFVLCVIAYLYQVGVVRRHGAAGAGGIPQGFNEDEEDDEVIAQQGGFGAAGGGGAGGQRRDEIPEPAVPAAAGAGGAAGVAADGNGVAAAPVDPLAPPAPPRPTGMLVNIEKFIVGFFASLVPTWNPPPP